MTCTLGLQVQEFQVGQHMPSMVNLELEQHRNVHINTLQCTKVNHLLCTIVTTFINFSPSHAISNSLQHLDLQISQH